MNRLDFIKFILGTGMNILFHPLIKGLTKEKKIFLCEFFIAGYQYYEGDEVIKNIRKNEELILRREPENRYDDRAIEILTKSEVKLGYVPMVYNEIPSRMMDQKIGLKLFVSSKKEKAPSWEKLKVKLYEIRTEPFIS